VNAYTCFAYAFFRGIEAMRRFGYSNALVSVKRAGTLVAVFMGNPAELFDEGEQ